MTGDSPQKSKIAMHIWNHKLEFIFGKSGKSNSQSQFFYIAQDSATSASECYAVNQNMTVWSLAENGINFSIAAGLIGYICPVPSNLVCNEGEHG